MSRRITEVNFHLFWYCTHHGTAPHTTLNCIKSHWNMIYSITLYCINPSPTLKPFYSTYTSLLQYFLVWQITSPKGLLFLIGFELSSDTASGPGPKKISPSDPLPSSSSTSTSNTVCVADLIAKQIQSLCLRSDTSTGIPSPFLMSNLQIIVYHRFHAY